MKTMLRKCTTCNTYTMKESCPACNGTVIMPIPARYSPQDNWGEYRRRLKKMCGMKSDDTNTEGEGNDGC